MSLEWFEWYTSRVNVVKPVSDKKYACPCCGFRTLDDRGGDDICPVCFWEDDGQDDHDADEVRGGPNYELSLSQARLNFAALGASDQRRKQFVRPPLESEREEQK